MLGKIRFGRTRLISGLGIFMLLLLAQVASAQTYFVDSLGDQPLENSNSISCISTASTCTLRAAIQANNNRTTTSATLNFSSIPVPPSGASGDGVISRIVLNSALPAISNRITIAGETHPNFDADKGLQRVVLDGTNLTTNNSGFFFNGSGASNSIVRHVSIIDFRNYGISVNNADSVLIANNRLGSFVFANALDLPGGNDNFGVSLAGSSGSQVLDNRITRNEGGGIRLASGASDNLVAGNAIGVGRVSGSSFIAPNLGVGISVLSSAGAGNEIGRCVILPPAFNFCRGNTIVASDSDGIRVASANQSIVVNSIEVNPDVPANSGYGNGGHGIRVSASDIFIGGGIAPGGVNTANTIGYNDGDGIFVSSGSNITIASNRIGGNPEGLEFGNAGAGVRIEAGQDHTVSGNFVARNQIGIRSSSGPTEITSNDLRQNGQVGIDVFDWQHTIEGNTIGRHTLSGIRLDYPNNLTQFATVNSNWIGTRPDGTPDENGNGILVWRGRALIGNNQGRGNIIAGNVHDGIILLGSDESWIRSNFIGELPDGTPRGNGAVGIRLDVSSSTQGSALSRVGYNQNNTIAAAHVPNADGGNGLGNIIAHNSLGIRINHTGATPDFTRNRFRGNRIHGNENGGIQIFGTIGSVNEGAGEGPNRLLNHPQLDDNATYFNSSNGDVEFRVNVPTAASQATYPLRLDFYVTDPGESQGRFFIGTVAYPASAANSWVSGSFSPVGGYALDEAFIVAMATDGEGNSSEFSANPADLSVGSPSPLDNIVISSFGDAPNADPNGMTCDTGNPFIAPGVPNCTLRAAIQAANNQTDPVTITFWEGLAAPGGVSTFAPQTQLPAIASQVTLAGETHASFDPDNGPSVVISGQNQSTNAALFRVRNASNVELRHIAFVQSPREGLSISNSSNVVVRDSLFGLRPEGGAFVAAGNSTNGINVSSSSLVGLIDNWVADNGQRGVQIGSGASNIDLVGSTIGAGRDGAGNRVPLGNNSGVVVLSGVGDGIHIGRCTVSLPVPVSQCVGNVIVANAGTGVSVSGSGVSLAANFIGIDPASPGNASFGNQASGVILSGSDHIMTGGLVIGEGANVIGHSASDGLVLNGNDHLISGVFVGTTPNGDAAGNGRFGIFVETGSGHSVASSRISNNIRGIVLDSSGNEVRNTRVVGNDLYGIQVNVGGQRIEDNVIGNHAQGGILYGHPFDASEDGLLTVLRNRIGVDTDGTPLPNQFGMFGVAAGRTLIGDVDGDGNIIAFNEDAGLVLASGRDHHVRANWIGLLPDGTPAGNGSVGVLISTLPTGGLSFENEVGFGAIDEIPQNHADGSAGASGNVIAHHDVGIVVNTASPDATVERNSLRGNRFVANGVAVQLGDTPGGIDPGGAQSGPNRLQNPPEFNAEGTSYDGASENLTFSFRVDTLTSNANYPLRVDIYLVEGGQPGRFLHTEVYMAGNATQFVSGSFVPPAGLVNSGDQLVGMATDLAGNSSEFSEPVSLGELSDEIFTDRFEF